MQFIKKHSIKFFRPQMVHFKWLIFQLFNQLYFWKKYSLLPDIFRLKYIFHIMNTIEWIVYGQKFYFTFWKTSLPQLPKTKNACQYWLQFCFHRLCTTIVVPQFNCRHINSKQSRHNVKRLQLFRFFEKFNL